jgi:phosphatidylserine/phosphatidylglycerophosphate/cardiolipin synthase-like enzyme
LPWDKRERNQAGRLGKLHAKAAVIDDTVVISSANLTYDAFNRNLKYRARCVRRSASFPAFHETAWAMGLTLTEVF